LFPEHGFENDKKEILMSTKPGFGFKIWTAFLSVFVAVMLFPNILGKHEG
jgi:hypothetical protein